ncbi:Cysteine-rich receptor protein kinase 25 [Spatholobus suberectus]|nr:Cysteine-rich receptor protein kinase 25 [Spatholobus suberectus]
MLPLLLISLFRVESLSSSIAPVYNANYCPNNASYQSNGTFQTNLNVLLASLVSNVCQSDDSYYSAMGMGTTCVTNGQFLRHSDVTTATCQDCITTVAIEITQRQPLYIITEANPINPTSTKQRNQNHYPSLSMHKPRDQYQTQS